jgi:cyclopropane fatty-acyl-phospholipid synthase-like methyltransferase
VNKKKTIVLEYSLPLVNYLKKRFSQVRVIHDEHLISRIHPNITEMDSIVSVGLLSHIQDLASYLNHVRTIVPEGGSIRFFDYADFYKFIPNQILPDDQLREIFKKHGFAVNIERIKGIFWTYLIIEGVRTDDENMVFA